MSEEKILILKKEVEKLTNEIVKKQEEIMELDVVRDALQEKIELYKHILKKDEELKFYK